MELDRIFALAKIVKQRLNCSQQMPEYRWSCCPHGR